MDSGKNVAVCPLPVDVFTFQKVPSCLLPKCMEQIHIETHGSATITFNLAYICTSALVPSVQLHFLLTDFASLASDGL